MSLAKKNLSNLRRDFPPIESKKTYNSAIYICFLTEPKIDTLHVLDCKQELFMNFKREIFAQLQQDMLILTETDSTPLFLLENVIKI